MASREGGSSASGSSASSNSASGNSSRPESNAQGSSRAEVAGLEQDVRILEKAVYEVKRVIVGQDRLVERILVGLLARGHVLLEGVPGRQLHFAGLTGAATSDQGFRRPTVGK